MNILPFYKEDSLLNKGLKIPFWIITDVFSKFKIPFIGGEAIFLVWGGGL